MLIAAAFIGPGTVATCLGAGVSFGYSLLWALLLSIIITIVLQEISGRIGLTSTRPIPAILESMIPGKYAGKALIGLILLAIVLGNSAYEAGNIAGGTLGLEALFGSGAVAYYPFIVILLAGIILWMGSYKLLERIFTALVLIMSMSFILTALLVRPDLSALFAGLFYPKVTGDTIMTVMALIGTTVVPYNLFLYPALVRQRWEGAGNLSAMRRDIIGSVLIGGIVSMAILVTGAGTGMQQMESVLDMAKSLSPIYGTAATVAIGVGLLAAGLTSSITAPLAAAYVIQQSFGWAPDNRSWKFRLAWGGVLLIGLLSLTLNIRPLEVIFLAQVANALLLPLVAFLFWRMASDKQLLGEFRSSRTGVIAGLIIVILVGLLALRTLYRIFVS